MLNSVYKFIPARAEFFDNFLLRASNKWSLNDPFEARPSFDYWADLCISTRYERFGKTKEEIISYLEKQPEGSVWSELGISLYRDYGVISFCEEKDNLLMWSHYTDEHYGMVVEFDSNNKFFNSLLVNEQNSAVGRLNRVMYRKSRLNNIGGHLMEPYFHKSDEWGYEKEHRLLLDLYRADTYLIQKKYRDFYKSSKYITDEDVSDFTDTLLKINNYCGSSIVNEPTFMAMFEVPVEAIMSVSFGIKATDTFKHAVESKLACEKLEHVQAYCAQIDPYDYRIRFEKNIIG